MTRINPDTLLEETEEEQQLRQTYTGVLSIGRHVTCHPNLEDLTVYHQQHRAVCLTRPHQACTVCPHSSFTLMFDAADGEERYTQVACPRWNSKTGRQDGDEPYYVMTELATCENKPFEFCASCPSKEDLHTLYSADKVTPGWYPRFKRLREREFNGDE